MQVAITTTRQVLNTTVHISSIAQKHSFWDMNINKLSLQKDKQLIIPRVLMSTNEQTFQKDITSLERAYAPQEIYTVLKNTKERISNELCKMIAQRYKKPTFLRYKF